MKISALGLAILAADPKRVEEFLKTKSKVNFSYSEEKKQTFVESERKFDPALNTADFIKKHLYTSKFINPNDPLLHSWWTDGVNLFSYSLAHLAVNPYIAKTPITGMIPNYLPELLDFREPISDFSRYPNYETFKKEKNALLQRRKKVVDILAAYGAHFDCLPYTYQKVFLDKADFQDKEICAYFDSLPGTFHKAFRDTLVSHGVKTPDTLLKCERIICMGYNLSCSTQEDLLARSLFYGVNPDINFSFYRNSEERKKFEWPLLKNALAQMMREEIKTEKLYPSIYVKDKFNEIKADKIENINELMEIVKKTDALTDPNWEKYDIKEDVKEILCTFVGYYKTADDREAAFEKLSEERERLERLVF
jgi:hypothetical protein